MCKNCANEVEVKEYINIQTGERLDLERAFTLSDNSMLKVKPKLWCEWDFEKNDVLGCDIWIVTRGMEKSKVWWICPKCKSDYDSYINNRINDKACPYCRGLKVNHTNSLASLNPKLASEWHPTKNGDSTPNDVTCGTPKRAWWLCERGHYWNASIASRNSGKCCPYCANKKVWIGFNDMWTTNPELASLLTNSEDGYNYMQFSHKKVDWECPCCGEIIKNKKISDINSDGLSCPSCSKSKSFPEKMMIALLNEIKRDYINDSSFVWSSSRRYDFYIPSLNLIVEMHGEQHYVRTRRKGARTLEEEQANDQYKYEMAIQNGIKPENYIVINCKKSNVTYIKNNILNSRLAEIFNLSNVDWISILNNSYIDTHKIILNMKDSGCSLEEIAKSIGYNKESVRNILNNLKSQ